MACISKLANAIAYDCDTGATGLTNALIINKADIASYTVNPSTQIVSGLTLVSGARAYKIDTVKRSLVMSEALKINEGAPNAYTHTATILSTMGRHDSAVNALATAISNGSFVILTKSVSSAGAIASVYGLYYGMSATTAERSSHDNGSWFTYTLETPENVIGEDQLAMGLTEYNALFDAAVG